MEKEEMNTVYTSYRYSIVLIMMLTISAMAYGQEYFQWTQKTGEYATVGMLVDNEVLINGQPIAPGDEIGVFTPDGLCVGGMVWCGQKNRAITVWGNNPLTEEIDGIRQNERIHYRIWQKETDTVVEVKQVNYEQGDELYRSFGIYVVGSLMAYDEIRSLVQISPENGAVNISTDTLLVWNDLEGAEAYRVQLSTNYDFSTTILDSTGILTPELTINTLEYGTEYFWRLRAVHGEYESDWSAVWSFNTNTITSANSFTQELPVDFSLYQNYPNPFNPSTTIRFALPAESTVRMEIYNMLGQRVTTLVDGEQMRAGIYEKVWDGRDAGGMHVSSGNYIYRVVADEYVETKRMTLIK